MSEGVALEVALDPDEVDGPADRDKAVSAAYLRSLGGTQEVAARGAGVGMRTLRRWESCSWWPEIQREALERWHGDLSAAARRQLLKAIKAGDGKLALDVLERTDPRLSKKEVPVARIQEMLGETVRIIREELDEATASRVLARVRAVWR